MEDTDMGRICVSLALRLQMKKARHITQAEEPGRPHSDRLPDGLPRVAGMRRGGVKPVTATFGRNARGTAWCRFDRIRGV
jgi:hypothetical protein